MAIKLQLNEKVYTLERFKLREWLELEQNEEKVRKAIAARDVTGFSLLLTSLVAVSLKIPVEELQFTAWYEVALAYEKIREINVVRKIPLIEVVRDNQKDEPWEYEGREWFWWFHTFAKEYKWTKQEVEDLDIDEAISLLQEILLNDQLEKEWQWQMTEIAYPYDETTKKSKFRPLSRPDWMTGKAIPVLTQKVRFKKGMLPQGRMIREDGHDDIVH